MEKWYFTFDVDHPFSNTMIAIKGDFDTARDQMVYWFGENWSSQYNVAEASALISKYGYQVINK